MVDDFLTTKRPADARELVEKIKAKYPTDKARRILHAAVREDPRYLAA